MVAHLGRCGVGLGRSTVLGQPITSSQCNIVSRNATKLNPNGSSNNAIRTCRNMSSFRFFEDRDRAAENVYMRKADEQAIRKLLNAHPEYDQRYQVIQGHDGKLSNDIELVCAKHGIMNVSKDFVTDLIRTFEENGWKKSDDEEHTKNEQK